MFLFIMACWSKLSWCRKHVNPVQIIVRALYIYIFYLCLKYLGVVLFVLEISGGQSYHGLLA